jgi:predicted esterase YcpF (UPF0227 family)
MILYLHGLRSSPDSFKARLLANAMAQRNLMSDWRCPQLPANPQAAITLAMALARQQLAELAQRGRPSPRGLTVIGSSLGGYYATWLAEQLDCKAILLNPVVPAGHDRTASVGQPARYHVNKPFNTLTPFTHHPEYLDELNTIQVAKPTHLNRYLLIAATGDEILNWRAMKAWYAGCQQHIVIGSNHVLSDFATWISEVLAFALAPPKLAC